jgi:NADPH:quinone reductase-like Zn-dependent oxidoreductase
MVALQALRDIAGVEEGQKVLVNGASGGIGTFAVQIGAALGAEVTGVCSSENLDLVRSLGADHVLDYAELDYTEGEEQYDCILDIADNRSLAARRRVLSPDGTLIPNSGEGGRMVGSLGRIIAARVVSVFVRQDLHPFLSLPKRADLLALADLIEAGKVTPVVGRTFSLPETAEAVEFVGRAVQNLLLAARAHGLGAVMTTQHFFVPGEFEKVLELPKAFTLAAIVPVGWPAVKLGPTRRPDPRSFISWDRWGQTSSRYLGEPG